LNLGGDVWLNNLVEEFRSGQLLKHYLGMVLCFLCLPSKVGFDACSIPLLQLELPCREEG
jgi:hypothetical protein